MSREHTAGPWIYDIHEHSFYIFTKADMEMVADGDPDQGGIARMRGTGRGADADEQEANARLIAAAPDLLDFIKRFTTHLERMNCITREEQPFMNEAAALIQKAEGGE